MDLLIPTAFGFAVVLLVMASASLFASRPERQRLDRLDSGEETEAPSGGFAALGDAARSFLLGALTRLAPRAAREEEKNAQMSELRLRLVQAGHRSTKAIVIYMGGRIALAAIAPAIMLMFPWTWKLEELQLAFSLCGAAGAAFILPSYWLDKRTKHRQLMIQHGLPDALDLMVVCVEAGLGINAALQRVSQEYSHAHPILAQEFAQVSAEIRAGKGTMDALRDLAERTGVVDLSSFVSMLIQTERFGTSMADALRVHSDAMRVYRLQRAEEAAAKAPLKMLFPAALFIFPATLMVSIGPGLMQLFSFFSDKR